MGAGRVRRFPCGAWPLLAIALAGCAPVVSRAAGPGSTPAPSHTAAASAYRAGQTGVLRSPSQHAALTITPSRPSVSTTALSTTFGDPPLHGYYVTFHLVVTNTGHVPVEIDRLDFWVATPGARRTTTNEGNAPFSGSSRQLDTTELAPGHSLHNDLTFDVARPTGTLVYGAKGRRELAWTY